MDTLYLLLGSSLVSLSLMLARPPMSSAAITNSTIAGNTATGGSACPTITLSAIATNGSVGSLYSQSAIASPAGSYTYTVTSGAPPPGVTLFSFITAGLLYGYPTTVGTYNFTLTATDATGCAGSQSYTVIINTPPAITAASVTRTAGAPVSNSTIATVSDVNQSAGTLTVTVTSANPSNGVTLSNIVNTGGTVTADVVAACGATTAGFTLTATDSASATATATLTVTVNANITNLVVNNNNDGGTDSLRAVIAHACAGSTITFAPNVRGAINLTSGELLVGNTLTITGPGANRLTVQRSTVPGTPAFRIFTFASASVNATLSGLTIANGNAPTFGISGGGISNNGTLTITNSTISGNTASASSGGGILNSSGTMTIINSTISGNSALGGFGGGILNTGTLDIINSTISGNTASEPGFGASFGGGIHNDGGTVTVTNSTISGNTAQFRGGGLNSSSGTITARNTIVALNTSASGPDVFGALTSQGFNLIGDSSGATIAPAQLSDQIGVTPAQLKLGLSQNNGGPTQTHALLSGSVAIDKGHSSGSTTDQRGFARPVVTPGTLPAGDGSDIGAYEMQASALRIDTVTSAAGRISGGQQITLTGAFANLLSVTVGSVSAPWAYSNGTSEVTLTTPPHADGVVTIDLTPLSGSPYTKTNAFAYLLSAFTDNTLVVGVTTAKAQHIRELRQAVDSLRVVAGLPLAPWTDPTLLPFALPFNTAIKAVHVTELRTYLENVAALLGYSTATYTDPSLGSGLPIRRVHIEELRQRIRTIAG